MLINQPKLPYNKKSSDHKSNKLDHKIDIEKMIFSRLIVIKWLKNRHNMSFCFAGGSYIVRSLCIEQLFDILN
jgi:hypothetical protein